MVKVISVQLPRVFSGDEGVEERHGAMLRSLEEKVNDILREHRHAKIEWLQSSSSANNGFTQLTAIVSWMTP
ncbi:MAG: hypothetical protein Q7T01_00700 [bacterium]|nr:hypothetical protein [bacterium]